MVLILLLIVSLAGLSSFYGYERVVTYGLIPFTMFYSLQLNSFKIFSLKNYFIRLFIFIIIWSSLLIVIAVNPDAAIKEIMKLIGVLFTLIMTYEALKYNPLAFIKWFLLCYVIAFYIIFIHLYFRVGGVSVTVVSIDRSTETLGLNANTFSYYSFFANIALFYLIEITRKKIFIILSIITILLGFYVAFITASRSGLVFSSIISIVYWIFIHSSNKGHKLLQALIAIPSVFYGITVLLSYYENSFLRIRVDNSLESGDSREGLAEEAINVFMDHPFTGVGPGQFYLYGSSQHSFSHNSYTEISANLGILGLIALLLLLISPLYKSIKRWWTNKCSNFSSLLKLNVLFFFLFALYNNFYVFYLTTFGMMFFLVVTFFQDHMYKEMK